MRFRFGRIVVATCLLLSFVACSEDSGVTGGPGLSDGTTLSDGAIVPPDGAAKDGGGSDGGSSGGFDGLYTKPDGVYSKDGGANPVDGGADVLACGVFGEPCLANVDCCSAWCVETFDGFQCTEECVENCPEGFSCKTVLNTWPDVVSICVPKLSKLCHECTNDMQCNGGQCIPIGNGSYCTADCSKDACPSGYDCTEAENGSKRCLPTNGTCDCDESNAGAVRPCATKNEHGICNGVETCDPAAGWGACDAKEAEEELCDGLDNDCDGLADEDFQEALPCVVENEAGACSGVSTCQGSAGWVCTALEPSAEVCDFLDNDCDGKSDEDFKSLEGKYTTLHHCGGCNKDCEGLFPHATATCDGKKVTPQCVVDACEDGYYKANEFQCIKNEQSLCQPCSEDFQCGGGFCVKLGDGSYCSKPCAGNDECGGAYLCLSVESASSEPLGLGCVPKTGACDCGPVTAGQKRPCTSDNELGTCFGFETCDPDEGWSSCDAVAPAPEECDGVDNDCNGLVDDGLPVTQPCQSTWPGVGTCGGEATCFGTAGWVCSAPKPTVELCDYKDNDCDGLTDEPFKDVAGKYATAEHCGACGSSCDSAIPNATAVCDPTPTTPLCIVDECKPGFYKVNDYLCLKEGDSFCRFCASDAQCDGKQCVQVGDGSYCTEPCEADGDCPDGFGCAQAFDPDLGASAGYCVPDNGTCDCNPDTAGAKKPCEVSNDIGTCVGFSVCDPAVGWAECGASPPVAEECDGLDNDCNGLVDDGLPASKPCQNDNEYGSCVGAATCAGGQGWLCSATVPAAEVCDFIDNDCDGSVDEDFKIEGGKYGTDAHCGTCNAACGDIIDHAKGEKCDATKSKPQCVVTECEDGFYKLNDFQCIDQPKVACFPCADDSSCFGGACVTLGDAKVCVDACMDDGDCTEGFGCDGSHCMPLSGSCDCTEATKGVKKFCAAENEFGTCVGFSTCDPLTGWGDCDAGAPVEEVCNGLDDDCDGVPDDGLPVTQPCEQKNAFGTCSGEAVCQGSLGWVCKAPVPAAETCDFKDNDCDGGVDEEFKNGAGKYAVAGHCGTCNKACGATVANSAAETCDTTKQVPLCIATSCKPGYFKQSELQCVPNPAVACTPCVADDTCFGGKCTTVGGGKFCLETCGGGVACKAGYTCDGTVCKPQNDSCDCSAATAGAKRTCTKSNELGQCLGFETCDPAVGWGGCTALLPKIEECNGKDDDCNGLIDDGLPSQQVCANKNGYGTCSGFAQCYGSAGWVCLAPEPGPEVCDFKDNNCNGQTDELFKDADGKYSSQQHCGTCNNECGDQYVHSLTEVCDASKTVPQCVVSECDEGYLKLNDFQCLEIPDVACAPCSTDANCFGSTCAQVGTGKFCLLACEAGACPEGYFCGDGVCHPWNGTCDCTEQTAGNKRTCFETNGLGTCYGFETCDPQNGWTGCDAVPPKTEECNGVDDDCNGFIDDGLPPTQACEQKNAFGTCKGSAACFGTVGWFCQAPKPAAEICDYKDNDCDGLVDEEFKDTQGQYGSDANCGGCGVSCDDAVINGVASCDATKPVPQCVVESCALGWQKYNDFLCIPITSSLCEPCAVDENCVAEGAKCVPLLDGMACGIPCAIDTDCPIAYLCEDVGVGDKQCVPATGSCECDGSNLDLQRACTKEYEPPGGGPVTTCFGTVYCTATGWTQCTLLAEVCNGVDDNCDGQADETFKDAQGKYVSDQHCGKCNLNCAQINFENASGVCNAALPTPDCKMKCNDGFFDTDSNPGNGCECEYAGAVDYPDGQDQNCDGIDGEIDKGIFVGKSGADTNPGTIAQPKLTIQGGIDGAVAQGKRDVYVQTGVYSENVVLAAGVGVYGGYDANYHTRDILTYETAIIGVKPTSQKRGAVNAVDIKGAGEKTVLDGFTVFGFDNKEPSGTSYAVYVRNCDARLRVSANRILAGSGGNGALGDKGIDGPLGDAGGGGVKAKEVGTCSAGIVTSGGGGHKKSCGAVQVNGGDGGGGYCPDFNVAAQNPHENGLAGANGGGLGGGQGFDAVMAPKVFFTGSGTCQGHCGGASTDCYCDSACSTWGDCCLDACTACGVNCPTGTCDYGNGCGSCIVPFNNLPMTGADGGDGNDGTPGSAGEKCAQPAGSVGAGLWVPVGGAKGGDGGHGAGGGGGGAGNGVETCGCSAYGLGGNDVGGTGGGGGSGGCGSTGGGGGGGGGGSFGLFFYYDAAPASAPVVEYNAIQRGNGGLGGPGGNAGVGGKGGLGGKGGDEGSGDNATFCAGKGGNGGEGGHGGEGGGGGGGCGGASYAMFVSGKGGVSFAAMKTANVVLPGGQGGQGGQGGLSLGNTGVKGDNGAFEVSNF